MTGYAIDITCPKCGAEMIPGDSARLAPDKTTHEARCESCMDLWRITVTASICQPWPVDRSPQAVMDRTRLAGAAAAVSTLGFG